MSPNAQKAIDATSTTVRPTLLMDLPAILDISSWAACHTTAYFRTEPDTLEHWIDLWKSNSARYPWFVAERDGIVTGFAMASPFMDRCGFLHAAEVTVYVHPDYLGKHIGHALYALLVPTLRAQGFRTLIAVITTPNPASETLHEHFCFKRVGKLLRTG